jgi:hypothetical protein
MREWLVDLVGEGMAPVASFVLAAAIVVILVFVVIWVAKRALGGQIGNRAKGRGPRLAVMDVTPIDPKRKLVLVRRDEVEHLILIGGQNDVVIEANILRVAAGTRTQRTEPSFRPDDAPAGERRAPAAPQRLAPASAAPQPARQPANGPARNGVPAAGNGVPAAGSPLARAVPRPPAAADDGGPAVSGPAASVETVEPVLRAEPPAPVAPPVAPEAKSAEAERREPSFSAAIPVAPPVAPIADRGGPAPTPEATPAAEKSAPPVAAPGRSDASSRVQGEAAPQVVASRPAADMAPPAVDRARDVAPASEGRSAARPAESERPVPPRAPAIDPGFSARPLARTPVATSPAGPAQNGVPRVAITGAGEPGAGTAEPVRRPVTVAAAPARSMVTPTYSNLSPQMFRQDSNQTAESVPASPTAAPEPVADRGGPSAEGRGGSQDSVEPRGERAPTMREMAPRAGEPSSAVIAAAERQRELIRARPTPTMTPRPPAESPTPGADSAERAKTESRRPEPTDAPAAVGERPPAPAEASPDRKPLEVRSFAAAIQAGPRAMPAPSPDRSAKAPAPPSPVEPNRAAVIAPIAPMAPMTVQEPEKAAAPAEDAFAGLDDFLSAELDFGLDDVHWNDEPANAAPEVRVDEPKAAEPAPAPAPDKAPRVLSLEEEMERLLGDFNFETSDRSRR